MTDHSPTDVLTALADPGRRTVLDVLARRGTATATELATECPMTRQAVSKHLAVLEGAGLVSAERTGRTVHYTPRSAALDATATWMTELASAWDRRLETIKRIAEDTSD